MKIFPVKPFQKARWAYQSNSVTDGRYRASGFAGGAGDYYGSGMKNPMGKMRKGSVGYVPVSKEELGIPPRGLA